MVKSFFVLDVRAMQGAKGEMLLVSAFTPRLTVVEVGQKVYEQSSLLSVTEGNEVAWSEAKANAAAMARDFSQGVVWPLRSLDLAGCGRSGKWERDVTRMSASEKRAFLAEMPQILRELGKACKVDKPDYRAQNAFYVKQLEAMGRKVPKRFLPSQEAEGKDASEGCVETKRKREANIKRVRVSPLFKALCENGTGLMRCGDVDKLVAARQTILAAMWETGTAENPISPSYERPLAEKALVIRRVTDSEAIATSEEGGFNAHTELRTSYRVSYAMAVPAHLTDYCDWDVSDWKNGTDAFPECDSFFAPNPSRFPGAPRRLYPATMEVALPFPAKEKIVYMEPGGNPAFSADAEIAVSKTFDYTVHGARPKSYKAVRSVSGSAPSDAVMMTDAGEIVLRAKSISEHEIARRQSAALHTLFASNEASIESISRLPLAIDFASFDIKSYIKACGKHARALSKISTNERALEAANRACEAEHGNTIDAAFLFYSSALENVAVEIRTVDEILLTAKMEYRAAWVAEAMLLHNATLLPERAEAVLIAKLEVKRAKLVARQDATRSAIEAIKSYVNAFAKEIRDAEKDAKNVKAATVSRARAQMSETTDERVARLAKAAAAKKRLRDAAKAIATDAVKAPEIAPETVLLGEFHGTH